MALASHSVFETGSDFVLAVRLAMGTLELVSLMMLDRVWYLDR